MIPDNNCSTQRRPIANFEYIFQYGGFNDLRQKFMNNDEEGESYDSNTDTKTWRCLNMDSGEYYDTKETFKEHYSSLLSKQYGLSLENIDNHCYELDDDVKIKTYLKRTLLLLDHLLNDVENSRDLNIYPESKVILHTLITFIEKKYGDSLSKVSLVEPDTISATKNDENPHPRIFTSLHAYNKFMSLLAEFGIVNKPLANYSFVFHRMKKDVLLFEGSKQIEFIDMLSYFDIHLDRIKPLSQLGNNDLRESIYNKV